MQVRHQILAVKDSHNVVQNALVDGKPRIARALNDQQNFFKRRADLDRGDLDSRHHHVFHLTFGKLQDPFEHSTVFMTIAVDQGAKFRIRGAELVTSRIVCDALGRKTRNR